MLSALNVTKQRGRESCTSQSDPGGLLMTQEDWSGTGTGDTSDTGSSSITWGDSAIGEASSTESTEAAPAIPATTRSSSRSGSRSSGRSTARSSAKKRSSSSKKKAAPRKKAAAKKSTA